MNQPLHRFKAELFKALGHPLRIKIVETLRSGEVSVAELLRRLDVEPATASQQLGVLRSRGLVDSRREGTTVYYRLRDPLVLDLLKVARAMSAKHLVNVQELLAAEMREEGITPKQTGNTGRRPAAVS